MARPIGVFIINEHRLFREAVAASLSYQPELVLLGAGNGSDEALQKSRDQPIDVVLIDAVAGRRYVNSTIAKLKQKLPDVKVVVLSVAHNADAILDFIESGANGYALKHASLAELLDVIVAVNNEELPCSPAVAASLFLRLSELSREQRRRQTQCPARLTQRESEILRLVAAHLGNKEIAQRLNLSLSTVKNHVHSILKKLRVNHRQGAIRYVDLEQHANLGPARIPARSSTTVDSVRTRTRN